MTCSCGSTSPTVAWSLEFDAVMCDGCYAIACAAKQEVRDRIAPDGYQTPGRIIAAATRRPS